MIQIRKKKFIIIIFCTDGRKNCSSSMDVDSIKFFICNKEDSEKINSQKYQKSSKNCMRNSEMKCVQTPFECNGIHFVNVVEWRSLSGSFLLYFSFCMMRIIRLKFCYILHLLRVFWVLILMQEEFCAYRLIYCGNIAQFWTSVLVIGIKVLKITSFKWKKIKIEQKS